MLCCPKLEKHVTESFLVEEGCQVTVGKGEVRASEDVIQFSACFGCTMSCCMLASGSHAGSTFVVWCFGPRVSAARLHLRLSAFRGAMAPKIRDSKKWKDSEWRRSDKVRRQAIHAFIKSRKEELLRDVPRWAFRSKDTKRNELVRVGRLRFAEQPEDVQARYFDMVEVEERVEPAAAAVLENARPQTPAVPAAPAEPRAPAEQEAPAKPEAPAVPASVSSPAVTCTSALLRGDVAVKSAIMNEFAFLQLKFSGPQVFDVLAAAFRLLDHIDRNLHGESDRVKAAICLGMGAKLASVSPSHTLDIWKCFTSAKMLPYMRSVELRMVAAWAKHGL